MPAGIAGHAGTNVIVRTGGAVAAYFPMYAVTYDWGMIDGHKFDRTHLRGDEEGLPEAVLLGR